MKRFHIILLLALLTFQANAQKKIDNGFVETYVQYIPFAADLGLGLLGAKSEHSFLDRGIEAAIGAVTITAAVNLLKYTVREERPDALSTRSLPDIRLQHFLAPNWCAGSMAGAGAPAHMRWQRLWGL